MDVTSHTLTSSIGEAIILSKPEKFYTYSKRVKIPIIRPKGSAICWKCHALLAKPNKHGQVAGQIKCPRTQCKILNEVSDGS